MPSRPSLRRRLTVTLVLVVSAALVAFAVVLHGAFGRALWHQFDERLADDARAVAGMVEERAGPWEFEWSGLVEFERQHGAAYFEVWMDDGSVFARSPSLGDRDLKREGRAESTSIRSGVRLPDGRAGRQLQADLPPRHDQDGPTPSGRRVVVVVARATQEVDDTMTTLRLLLIGFGLITLAVAAGGGAIAIRSGLEPVALLSARVDAINAGRLGVRLPEHELPSELGPAVAKLNDLLARLEESFARERRFSGDVSHELRTPLSGLRSTLEVCLSRERPPAEYVVAVREALAMVGQLQGLVESLLLLTRLDSSEVTTRREPVALRPLITECLAGLSARASERSLSIDNQIAVDALVTADPGHLRSVVRNLLGNAVDYTAERGRIVLRADRSRGVVLEVFDSGPALPEADLERIFHRFVRLDSARTSTEEHSGIGLCLARALCALMGFSLTAANTDDGGLAFRVTESSLG